MWSLSGGRASLQEKEKLNDSQRSTLPAYDQQVNEGNWLQNKCAATVG